MPFIQNETDSVKDFLVLYGDLLIKTGQSGLRAAVDALPSDYSQLNDWCNYWLHERGKQLLLKSLNLAACKEARNIH